MREIKDIRDTFPYAGDKLIFTGVPQFYYPMYVNMGTRAKEVLVEGQEYVARKVEVYSSWCAVWLEGFENEKDCFNLGFFKEV